MTVKQTIRDLIRDTIIATCPPPAMIEWCNTLYQAKPNGSYVATTAKITTGDVGTINQTCTFIAYHEYDETTIHIHEAGNTYEFDLNNPDSIEKLTTTITSIIKAHK